MSKMFVGGCWYFLEKCWKAGGKRTRCPRQPIVDMDVDCRRPRHDENYSSLFVENSHPETLHRDMCIACSGSSWILPMYLTIFPFYAEMINLIHQKCWVSFLIVICPAGPNVYCCVPVDEKHWRPADGVVLPVRHSVFLLYLHLYRIANWRNLISILLWK